MKLTDLIIGDWVRYSPKSISLNNNYGGSYRVEGISQDTITLGAKNYRFVASDKEIDPILLTPEILEKNGWNLDTVLQCYTSTPLWLYGEGIINLLLQFPAKQSAGSLEIFDNQKIRSLFDFTWKDRLCIHDLQHALRLCGFNKLADDFKV